MQRARLASVAALITVGVLALTGCGRSQPGVAAYVGNHSYSQQDVDQVIDQVKDKVPAEQRAELGRSVVQMMVLRDAATDYARAHNITVPAVDQAVFAQQHGLPINTRYTELAASYSAAMAAVSQSAPSVAPTEADQREAFSNVTMQGQRVTDKFEAVRQYFSEQQIGRSVGLRNLLNDAVGQADVSVNPRYGELVYQVPVQIGQASSWLAVRLGESDSGAVVDAR